MVDNANTDDSVYLCDYDKEEVAELNSYLIDVIDALWRGRAFAGRDRNARNFHVSRYFNDSGELPIVGAK